MLRGPNTALLRRIVAIVLLTTAALLRAQQTPPLSGVAHVAIRVRSLDASRDFYEKLGFLQAFTLTGNDGKVTTSFIKINDRQFLELYPPNPAVLLQSTPAFLHICFETPSLESLREDYISRGLTATAIRKSGSGNLTFLLAGPRDATGTEQTLEYLQYTPGSLQVEDHGKHFAEDRAAESLAGVTLAVLDPAGARDFYLNQLLFRSIAGDPMFLHMPGDSGQEIEIAKAVPLGVRTKLTLRSPSLSKTARLLHKQKIEAIKSPDSLTLLDPDGNLIVIRGQ